MYNLIEVCDWHRWVWKYYQQAGIYLVGDSGFLAKRGMKRTTLVTKIMEAASWKYGKGCPVAVVNLVDNKQAKLKD